jgi:hypothetical protein
VTWTRFQPETSKMQAEIVNTDTILLVRNSKAKDTLHSCGELFNTIRLHSGVMMIAHYTVTKCNLTFWNVLVTVFTFRFNTKYSGFCLHNVFTCTVHFSQLTVRIIVYSLQRLVLQMLAHCVLCEVRTEY